MSDRRHSLIRLAAPDSSTFTGPARGIAGAPRAPAAPTKPILVTCPLFNVECACCRRLTPDIRRSMARRQPYQDAIRAKVPFSPFSPTKRCAIPEGENEQRHPPLATISASAPPSEHPQWALISLPIATRRPLQGPYLPAASPKFDLPTR